MVVIETPKGSPNYGTFGLKGLLPAGAVFPFDFGFVPSTRAEDGDPLDVLVLMDALVFSGHCVFTTQSHRVQRRDLGRSLSVIAV